jgi:phenylalanyl-tRNA synthetase beta subunit
MVRSDDNEFALFEIGKAHVKGHEDDEGLPAEFERLAFVFAADQKTSARKYDGSAYYQAKKYLTDLTRGQAEFKVLETNEYPISSPYQIGRSAMVYVGGELLGVIGELRSNTKKTLKLPDFCAGFELDLKLLQDTLRGSAYEPISTFPKTQQDVTFRVDESKSFGEVFSVVWTEVQNFVANEGYSVVMGPRDIFKKDNETSVNMTFRIWVSHPKKTLRTEEVNTLLDQISTMLKTSIGAERV